MKLNLILLTHFVLQTINHIHLSLCVYSKIYYPRRCLAAGCIVASVGIVFSRVCLFVRTLKGKRLELSTPNFVHVYSIAVAQHALTQRSKGQGHTATKTVMVAWLLVTRAATALCCCCRHGSAICMSVYMTACIF